MDCFNNTCLSCDRECEGHYCSPSCKLADHERAAFTSTSQSTASSPTTSRPKSWQTSRRTSSYVLEPAYEFRSKTSTQPTRPPLQPLHLAWNPSMQSTKPIYKTTETRLTPSSSRSSLSSTGSSSSGSNSAISAHDNEQLQDYFSSFEKVRAARRRSTVR